MTRLKCAEGVEIYFIFIKLFINLQKQQILRKPFFEV